MTYDIHIHACNLQLTIVACFTIIAVEQCIFFSLDICVCRHGAHEHGAVIATCQHAGLIR